MLRGKLHGWVIIHGRLEARRGDLGLGVWPTYTYGPTWPSPKFLLVMELLMVLVLILRDTCHCRSPSIWRPPQLIGKFPIPCQTRILLLTPFNLFQVHWTWNCKAIMRRLPQPWKTLTEIWTNEPVIICLAALLWHSSQAEISSIMSLESGSVYVRFTTTFTPVYVRPLYFIPV